MQIEPLLRKGYFPKELPPPFTTKYFAANFIHFRKKIFREEILKFPTHFTIQFYARRSVIIGLRSTTFVKNQQSQ